MRLVGVETLNGASRSEALRLAGAVEDASEHPGRLALFIADAACRGFRVLPVVSGFRNLPGEGVVGVVDGVEVRTVDRAGVHWDGELRARLLVEDTVKPTSAEAIRELRALGLTPVLLTGDAEATALRVAGEVGIERVLAEVYPGDKAAGGAAAPGGRRGRRHGRRRGQRRTGAGAADLGIAIGTSAPTSRSRRPT